MKNTDANLTEAIRRAIAIGLDRVAAMNIRESKPEKASLAARMATDRWDTELIAKTVRMIVPLRRRS